MANLIELTPHIYRLELMNATRTNIYIVREPDGDTLIDPGPVGTAQIILALDRSGEIRLRRVIVTHAHPAHAGSVARVARGPGVHTWVHPLDMCYLDGREPPLLPRGRRGQLMAALGRVVDPLLPTGVSPSEPLADAVGSTATDCHTRPHARPRPVSFTKPTAARCSRATRSSWRTARRCCRPTACRKIPARARESLAELQSSSFNICCPAMARRCTATRMSSWPRSSISHQLVQRDRAQAARGKLRQQFLHHLGGDRRVPAALGGVVQDQDRSRPPSRQQPRRRLGSTVEATPSCAFLLQPTSSSLASRAAATTRGDNRPTGGRNQRGAVPAACANSDCARSSSSANFAGGKNGVVCAWLHE